MELNIIIKYCHILIFYKCLMTGTFFLALPPITDMRFRNLEFSLYSVTNFSVLCCHLSRKLHETVQAGTRYKILFLLI